MEITLEHSGEASSSGGGQGRTDMDDLLLEAATYGNSTSMKAMVSGNPGIILGTTLSGNTCLHISALCGHEGFGKDVLELLTDDAAVVLLSATNSEGETPLLTAVASGLVNLASLLLARYVGLGLSQFILRQDNDKFNALHYATRNGYIDLAVKLIAEQPSLSAAVNKYNESPMFMAVMRDFTDVSKLLLEINEASHLGSYGRNALHAAARNGNQDIARSIMMRRPCMAKEADMNQSTPIRLAVCYNKVEVLRVLLQHDISLGYEVSNQGFTLFTSAATRGHVDVAQVLLRHCPGAHYRHVHQQELTCLHTAIQNGHREFVELILKTPQFRKLINMQDGQGKTALHYAIQKCDPRIVEALLSHKDIDTTIIDQEGNSAASQLSGITDREKTLDWKEVHVLMLKADPKDDEISLYKLNKGVEQRETIESRKERRSLTQNYRNSTSLVAILLATITFTAAFTLPGGYSSDPNSAGQPVLYGKLAFQAFLVFDTIGMCCAFLVAVICLMGRWEDDKFTTCYIPVTKLLIWSAYMATLGAFATGLYTVLASQHIHLARLICCAVFDVILLTMFISKWPVLRRNYRLGPNWPALMVNFKLSQAFKSDFHDVV